jgi:CBS domain containing-hemolysin-like protein
MMAIILVFVLGILFSALYSGAETGVYTYNMHKASTPSKYNQLSKLLKRRDSMVIACLIGTNLSVEITTLSFKKLVLFFEPHVTERLEYLTEMVVLIPILFLFAEVLPKVLMSSKSNILLPKMALFLWVSDIVYKPVIYLMQVMVKALSFCVGRQDRIDYGQTRQRLKWVLQDAGGGVSSAQSRMVRNVMDLQGRQVASLMKPIKSIELISDATELKDLKELFYKSQSNYMIVSKAGSKEVRGVVYMTPILFSKEGQTIEDFIHSVPEISNKNSVISALNELKKDNLPVAKVVSDNGNVLGMVFTRQIVQEVVGELPIW